MAITSYIEDLDIRTGPSAKSVAVVLDDTTELLFVDDNGPPEANTQLKYCRGFQCNNTGTLSYTDPGDTTIKENFCNKGNYYPFMVGRFRATGTDAAMSATNAIIARR